MPLLFYGILNLLNPFMKKEDRTDLLLCMFYFPPNSWFARLNSVPTLTEPLLLKLLAELPFNRE